jgi:hypothetical protein
LAKIIQYWQKKSEIRNPTLNRTAMLEWKLLGFNRKAVLLRKVKGMNHQRKQSDNVLIQSY